MKDTLRNLSLFNAPPGNEESLSRFISDIFSKHTDTVSIDSFNNVCGIKKSRTNNSKKIALYAHMDEIALMVTDIDKNGFINFIPIGGIDSRILLSQEVIIHGNKDVLGIIGAKPPNLQTDDDKKEIKIGRLYIDIAMTNEQARENINIGDYITFKGKWTELQRDIISSKSLDNRAGVAAVIEIMKELNNDSLRTDVVYNITTQEEVGLRGAKVNSFSLQPDLAVVIDAGFGDMPGLEKDETFILGGGPAIAVGPSLHPALSKELIKYAKKENIPCQIDVENGNTGTEAWSIQVSGEGVPVILVSIPLRYMHTTVETISMDDVKNTAKLISGFIRHIQDRLEELICF